MSRPRVRQTDHTGEALLAAGEAIVRRRLQEGVPRLGSVAIKSVIEAAGVPTTGAFYNRWPGGLDAFNDALNERMIKSAFTSAERTKPIRGQFPRFLVQADPDDENKINSFTSWCAAAVAEEDYDRLLVRWHMYPNRQQLDVDESPIVAEVGEMLEVIRYLDKEPPLSEDQTTILSQGFLYDVDCRAMRLTQPE